MSRKRKATNIIGLVCLGGFVLVIVFVSGTKKLEENKKVRATKSALDHVAEDFVKNREVVMQWAKGEYSDIWGNNFILTTNKGGGVQMLSKGPDGDLGTKDDIESRIFYPRKIPSVVKPKPQKNTDKTVMQKFEETKAKATEMLDKAKKSVENVEVEAEKKGWKWNIDWRWGKEKE